MGHFNHGSPVVHLHGQMFWLGLLNLCPMLQKRFIHKKILV